MTRVERVTDRTEATGPEYEEGLRGAVSAALDYGFAGIEQGEGGLPPLPEALLTQARLAASSNISLDTVLRRYFAGYTLLADFLMQEAESSDLLGGPALQSMLRAQATLFDRLVVRITEEYTRETEARSDTTNQRRIQSLERLLAGEPLDVSQFDYEFDAHHVGAIAAGLGAIEAFRDLAKVLDRRLLHVRCDERTVWAWLGGRSAPDVEALERAVSQGWPAKVSLTIGEPAQGLGGWRLTHQQARAALPVARRTP